MGDKHENVGHRERLRERFMRAEFSCFSQHEIVELMLTFSIPRRDVKRTAKILLKTFGSIAGIFDAEIGELEQIKGIGRATAISIKMIRAVNSLYLQEKFSSGTDIDSAEKAIALWRQRMSGLKVEVVEVAHMSSELRLMEDGIERLEEGTVASAVIYPRKIVESAMRRNSAAIMLCHNHTSGSADPSDCDERNTRALKTTLQHLDIALVDHIIISPIGAFSFRENGLL
ncbi:MAG: DNA repair protein RadC [Puniceicoccales bacterium]|nr:DNA repair protein RadC [Puniceicoccales bacterium]